jgi:hypothetical protein
VTAPQRGAAVGACFLVLGETGTVATPDAPGEWSFLGTPTGHVNGNRTRRRNVRDTLPHDSRPRDGYASAFR